MSTIRNIIRNLMRHEGLGKLSIFVSGFVRKIISNFLGLIRLFRRKKETIAVCASSIDQALNLGLLSEADHKKEHYEASSSFIPMELQRGTKAEEPEAAGNPLIQPVVKREHIFCRYCLSVGDHKTSVCPKKHYICTDCGTLFPCEKKDAHGEEHKVLNYCLGCNKWGHLLEMCPDLVDSDVNYDPPDW